MEEKVLRDSASLSADISAVEREYRQKMSITLARPRLVRAFFVAWGAMLVLGIVFFMASVGWYGAQGLFTDSAFVEFVANAEVSHARTLAMAPRALEVGTPLSVASGSDSAYDAYVVVHNPNTRHVARFSYVFTSASGSSEVRDAFLHPGESAPLFTPKISNGRPSGLSVALRDLSWVYLSPHDIADVEAWYEERSALSVDGVAFAHDIAYASGTVSRSTFTVHNRTAYSFWEPVFVVQLMRGSTVMGITEITLAQFLRSEARTVDLRWFGALPQTASVIVTPRIPFFMSDAYMDPNASTSSDVRTLWTTSDR